MTGFYRREVGQLPRPGERSIRTLCGEPLILLDGPDAEGTWTARRLDGRIERVRFRQIAFTQPDGEHRRHLAVIEELSPGRWTARLDGLPVADWLAGYEQARAAIIAAMRDCYGLIP